MPILTLKTQRDRGREDVDCTARTGFGISLGAVRMEVVDGGAGIGSDN